jgi:phage terminase large subunit-like protein
VKVVEDRLGCQFPTNYWMPDHVADKRADMAVKFLHTVGFHLDEWEELVFRDLLGQNEAKKWAALEAVLLVPRQNGKTAVIEALEIVHLFLFRTKLIIHTAHLFDTAKESYLRMCEIIENCPALDKYVRDKPSGNGSVSIRLKKEYGGGRLLYKARGNGQIRGFSGDLVILDEAYDLDPEMIAALIPALSARNNPQVIYLSSTGSEDSQVLIKARDRALAHHPRIALWEWCADVGADLDDLDQLYQANPGLGIRLQLDFILEVERGSMDDKKYARERFGLWHDNSVVVPIDLKTWASRGILLRKQPSSEIVSKCVVSIDAAPDRSRASIGLAGYTASDHKQVEVLHSDRGISWCVDFVERLYQAKHNPAPLAVALQSGGRAGALIPELEALDGVEVIPFGSKEIMSATGFIYDCVEDGSLIHLDDMSLTTGLSGARKYNIGGKVGDEEYNGWGWSRVDTTVDITGVCAITYALWGLNMKRTEAVVERKPYEDKPRGGRIW